VDDESIIPFFHRARGSTQSVTIDCFAHFAAHAACGDDFCLARASGLSFKGFYHSITLATM